jgi:hypothetical protein
LDAIAVRQVAREDHLIAKVKSVKLEAHAKKETNNFSINPIDPVLITPPGNET